MYCIYELYYYIAYILSNIIRSEVWKTRIDTNATWRKCLWEII